MYYYLKTDTEAQMWEALAAANLARKDYDPEDPLNVAPEEATEDWEPTGAFDWVFTGLALDVIGLIYKPTGEMLTDDEGMEYPEMAPIEDWHSNLIADEGLDLPIIVPPATPYRVWSGQ
jgi:hypothetical protein